MGRTRRSLHIPKRGMRRGFRWTLMRHFLFLALAIGGLPGGGKQAGALVVFAIALAGVPEALQAGVPGATLEAVDVAVVATGADDDLIAAAGA